MDILYVGSLHPGKTCLQRMTALSSLGNRVIAVDTQSPSRKQERTWPVRILFRLGHAMDLSGANRRILDEISRRPFDVLWIDKGLTVSPDTLRTVKRDQPACRLVSYSPDDMFNPSNQSRRYLACVPLYDLHVTTKTYNVDELGEMGAKHVLFVGNSYDPDTHKPLSLDAAERRRWGAAVSFIGGYEPERYRMLREIARRGYEVTVRCYSDEWVHARDNQNLHVFQDETFGLNYAKSIIASKINLCFLRKVNRDLQTTRSIEIPACGGFMLAERSIEHANLFEEGVEAEFFTDTTELIAKVDYYLAHDAEREAIARRGRERCIRSGYSNQARLRVVLDRIARSVAVEAEAT